MNDHRDDGADSQAHGFAFEVDGRKAFVVSGPSSTPSFAELTDAEQEVAELAAGGCTNADIASRRGSTARTVAKQLQSIYGKLGVASRAELAAFIAGGSST